MCVSLFAQSRKDLHYNVEEEKGRVMAGIFLPPHDDDHDCVFQSHIHLKCDVKQMEDFFLPIFFGTFLSFDSV